MTQQPTISIDSKTKEKAEPKKVAIFGGSFDPIHFGHLTPVFDAVTQFDIGKLIYLPCYKQPLKNSCATKSHHRLNMCKLALASVHSPIPTEISEFELEQMGNSYTINTLKYFKQLEPNTEFYFIVGMDSLLSFTQWVEWQNILEVCHLIVMARPQYKLQLDIQENTTTQPTLAPVLIPFLGKRIHIVENALIDISSTEIRQAFKNDDADRLQDWLPQQVAAYIQNNQLY
ncbi:nicotinate (nicotinamide) nucleotide adenylyltransferase [Psychrosphaera sp. 1_MG-2023]|uniref:nicotinate (nicotinamide) nucleotide adenylyltransferase n=1 Tax=Psychrosphaera sp. 1_MG-2023 TaxID=3062643 RepID=UPI0026E2C5A6|nr:nicotinate (nicotinamide) nucleotide adenylyltransferase [Psychrosphaera sp. 1_MG-2023]MDO6720067.1 nicotinate (nicotinamide) nucleotide adenylyltransferase [Psychrosphaera sp. 1_MG-2023]